MKVVFTCGRMNPPTLGHQRIIERMRELTGESGVPLVFLTRSWDRERNPLRPDEKVELVERAFGVPVRLTQSPYTAVEELAEEGIVEATFVIGQDRASTFQPLRAYAATLGLDLEFSTLDRTDEDVSATRARIAARTDLGDFRRLVPSPDEDFVEELFHAVRRGLGG